METVGTDTPAFSANVCFNVGFISFAPSGLYYITVILEKVINIFLN